MVFSLFPILFRSDHFSVELEEAVAFLEQEVDRLERLCARVQRYEYNALRVAAVVRVWMLNAARMDEQ